MNYSIDQIIENIAVCENTDTGEKIELYLSELPQNIKEGNIITLKDGKYLLNSDEETLRRQRVQDKLNRLKMLKNKE